MYTVRQKILKLVPRLGLTGLQLIVLPVKYVQPNISTLFHLLDDEMDESERSEPCLCSLTFFFTVDRIEPLRLKCS